jgi:hypothetical protein
MSLRALVSGIPFTWMDKPSCLYDADRLQILLLHYPQQGIELMSIHCKFVTPLWVRKNLGSISAAVCTLCPDQGKIQKRSNGARGSSGIKFGVLSELARTGNRSSSLGTPVTHLQFLQTV